MVTNVIDETNATSTSETSFARQQNSTAANTSMLAGKQDQPHLTKPAMVNPYRPPRKSTDATSTVPVLPEEVISPDEVTAEEWHALGRQYDPLTTNTDLFENIDPAVLAELEEEEEQENPALVSYEHDKNGAPSAAMRNIQMSLALLTDAERRTFLHQQITPSIAGTTSIHRSKTSALDISEITETSTVNRYFMPELATPFIPFKLPVYQNQATYTTVETDPLEAIMSQPRLSILQDLIRDLAASSLAATDALENKTSAAARLHDPLIETTPRSVRQKDFILTTIKEFQGHQIYKGLVMKIAELGAQYRKSLTDTIKELATHEVTWLKLLRIQQIITVLQPILASLIFRVEATIQRPTLPELTSPSTLNFFVFYWLMQLNVKLVSQRQTTKCFLTFFGLPFNDIVATAANILVENSPQAIANIINKLNNKEMDWDASNQHTGYYINNILRDLHAIVSAAVLDHVTYQQAPKNAKVIEAKTLAFVNKVRVKNTTALTQTTLDRVDTEVKKATVNEKDLLRRQKELETTIAKQQEEFNAYVKSQQKNSQGSSSAQWPQHQQIQWIPPQKTTTVPTIPASPPPTTTTTIPNKTKEIATNSTNEHAKSTKQKRTKKRKISQKK